MPVIIIEYNTPRGSNRDEIAGFVADALESWGGQFHPSDPLFNSLRGHMTFLKVGGKLYNELLTRFDNETPQT